eukprot:Protomagalhaensia_sp_Gyna_25__4838@NODE_4_length_9419_cov_51_362367_g3_i0_p2_GENE_NODE_4_length_9419_cov_51_362367_g3_i0NODE_4_length_9419_cov_51_362367_g3_i0_p2_ORF_typecomplete_len531_score70_90RNB/PF00773_19/8e65Dis3l2_C_term/PF17877_1/0_2_NODE_4_length_9419_cov_51_362367_g3_i067118303
MLPRGLSEQACSLNTKGPRLAFTCVFAVDYNGELLQEPAPQFFKSVIHSRYQLNYDQVQRILDQLRPKEKVLCESFHIPTYLVSAVDLNEIDDTIISSPSYPKDDLIQDLLLMEDITQKIRTKRFNNGSMTLHKVQLRFNCVTEEGVTSLPGAPKSLYVDKHTSSHELIEELMLLANKLVAAKLIGSPLSQLAVVRYHPSLDAKKAEVVENFMRTMQVPCDVSSSKGIQDTLSQAYRRFGPRIGMAVEQVLIQGLRLAQYGAYGSEMIPGSYHFALAFPQYTHFTSPIRRYPDILVHRLLDIVLTLESAHFKSDPLDITDTRDLPAAIDAAMELFGYNSVSELQEQCELCNEKKEQSKKAQDKAGVAWLLMYLASLPEPKTTLGSVLSVDDKSLNIFINEMGLRRRIEFQTEGSARIFSKLKREYRDVIEIPTAYVRTAEGTCRISWGRNQDREYTVMPCSAVPVWVLPTQDVPLDFLVIPLPPDHPTYKSLMRLDKETSNVPVEALLELLGSNKPSNKNGPHDVDVEDE